MSNLFKKGINNIKKIFSLDTDEINVLNYSLEDYFNDSTINKIKETLSILSADKKMLLFEIGHYEKFNSKERKSQMSLDDVRKGVFNNINKFISQDVIFKNFLLDPNDKTIETQLTKNDKVIINDILLLSLSSLSLSIDGSKFSIFGDFLKPNLKSSMDSIMSSISVHLESDIEAVDNSLRQSSKFDSSEKIQCKTLIEYLIDGRLKGDIYGPYELECIFDKPIDQGHIFRRLFDSNEDRMPLLTVNDNIFENFQNSIYDLYKDLSTYGKNVLIEKLSQFYKRNLELYGKTEKSLSLIQKISIESNYPIYSENFQSELDKNIKKLGGFDKFKELLNVHFGLVDNKQTTMFSSETFTYFSYYAIIFNLFRDSDKSAIGIAKKIIDKGFFNESKQFISYINNIDREIILRKIGVSEKSHKNLNNLVRRQIMSFSPYMMSHMCQVKEIRDMCKTIGESNLAYTVFSELLDKMNFVPSRTVDNINGEYYNLASLMETIDSDHIRGDIRIPYIQDFSKEYADLLLSVSPMNDQNLIIGNKDSLINGMQDGIKRLFNFQNKEDDTLYETSNLIIPIINDFIMLNTSLLEGGKYDPIVKDREISKKTGLSFRELFISFGQTNDKINRENDYDKKKALSTIKICSELANSYINAVDEGIKRYVMLISSLPPENFNFNISDRMLKLLILNTDNFESITRKRILGTLKEDVSGGEKLMYIKNGEIKGLSKEIANLGKSNN